MNKKLMFLVGFAGITLALTGCGSKKSYEVVCTYRGDGLQKGESQKVSLNFKDNIVTEGKFEFVVSEKNQVTGKQMLEDQFRNVAGEGVKTSITSKGGFATGVAEVDFTNRKVNPADFGFYDELTKSNVRSSLKNDGYECN